MTERIGAAVRHFRGDRTALWLSAATEALGHKIARSAISELETGKRRSISVAEWLVLSAALGVPPLLLLFPNFPDGRVDYLPNRSARSHNAFRWVDGRRALVADDDDTVRLTAHPTAMVDKAEQRHELNQRNTLDYLTAMTDLAITDEQRRQLFEGFAEQRKYAAQKIANLEAQIKDLGGVVDENGGGNGQG